MRESRLFLQFFKKNFVIIFTITIIFSTAGYFIQSSSLKVFSYSRLFQLKYNFSDITQKNVLADEAVATLRSDNIRKQLEIGKGNRLVIYKTSPLSLKLEVSGKDKGAVQNDLEKLSEYLVSKFSVEEVGERTEAIINANILLGILGGSILGFIFGLLAALVKTYFEKY